MIGDAFMIAFRTADDALDFAFQFHADTGHEAIKIRAGIHVGSVYIVDDDLYGKTVNYAARVVHAIPGDWIALSDAAKNDIDINRARARHNALVRITELGSNLKGFPSPNRIWRALTLQTDKAEKAKAAALAIPAERVVRPRLNLSPPPSGNDTSAPLRRNPLYGVLPPTSEPKAGTSQTGRNICWKGLLQLKAPRKTS